MPAPSRTPLLDGTNCPALAEAEDSDGHQSVHVLRDDLVYIRIYGNIGAGPELVRVTDALESHLQHNTGVRVFFDLEGFKRYHSDVRILYTQAIRQSLANTESVLVYSDSNLVRMGATVAGLVLPQLRLVSRTEFEDRFTAARDDP